MPDISDLELPEPTGHRTSCGIRAVIDCRLETDSAVAGRVAGLLTELATIDPVWQGTWRYEFGPWHTPEYITITPEIQPILDLFPRIREDNDFNQHAYAATLDIDSNFGGGLSVTPTGSIPDNAPPPRFPFTGPTRYDAGFTPKPALTEAGLHSRATTGTIGIHIFDAFDRWTEPDTLVYSTAMTRTLDPRTRPIDIGWISLLPPNTPLDTTLLPTKAILTTNPRNGATIIRLGNSPWHLTETDIHTTHAALGQPLR
ncbi:hypothetical protein [Nocardia sp. NPDC058497]|uniref:hypothetical protein n=1 Tax=Nocardia sp. NPDC058497 TaxID=3346529 RepID=UPI0036660278